MAVSATDADSNGLIDEHEAITEYYGGYTCGEVGCHPVETTDMFSSTHYTWKSSINDLGKINTQNSYCTSPLGTTLISGVLNGTSTDPWNGMEVGGGCGICHSGMGLIKLEEIGTGQWKDPAMNGLPESINVDCLICHAPYEYNRLTNFKGDENNPTATEGLPGDFANNPSACLNRTHSVLYGPANACTIDGINHITCGGTEENCIYDPVDLGYLTMDDRLVLNDERYTVIVPVAPGFVDDFYTLMGQPGLGVAIPGFGPRLTPADFLAHPELLPLGGSLSPGDPANDLPMNNQVAVSMAREVRAWPAAEACIRCHVGSGGGKNSKRGDIEMEPILLGATIEHDIHLEYDLDCSNCHIPINHQFPSESIDIPTGTLSFQCINCHYGHAEFNPDIDMHMEFIACQTCHITRIAKVEDTELSREWMNSGVNYGDTLVLSNPLGPMFDFGPYFDSRYQDSNGVWHPTQTRQANLTPGDGIEYIYWNGNTSFLLPHDDITLTSGEILMNHPQGGIGDGKIYPVKKHTTQMFIYNNRMTMVSVGLVFQGWGIENALRMGTSHNTVDPDGSLIEPITMYDTYFKLFGPPAGGTELDVYNSITSTTEPMSVGIQKASKLSIINHEVGPKENALVCQDCHWLNSAIDWAALGYSSSSNCDFDRDGFNSTSCGGTDCNDYNPGIRPGAPEFCDDGIDTDCDGLMDCADGDCAEDPVCNTCTIDFCDVPPDHWAYSYIEYLFCNGIINGYPNGCFEPGNFITRAQFAKMIVNANGIPEYHPATPTFSDVPSDHWSYGYVEAAVQAGIISGYTDGTFRPSNQVTRAQISAMIARSKGWTYSGGLEDFTDVEPSHWAYDNIMAMKEKGIIDGNPNGTFLPANQATRGQNSKMIANMMQTP